MTTDLENLLLEGIRQRRTPCAVLKIVRPGGQDTTLVTGKHTYDTGVDASETDLFDMASITKILATTALAMLFLQKGRLELDDTLDLFLPERRASGQPQPTIRQLLAHCGGCPPCVPYHRELLLLDSLEQKRQAVIATPLECAPGTATAYSDIGFMLLAFALERLGDAPLPELARDLVFRPLGMADTQFNPPPRLHCRCVPTEQIQGTNPPRFWQGTVHDENARWLGGAAGHAGIFSTADNLARFARVFLQRNAGFFSPAILDEFTRPAGMLPGSSRCLGWDSPTQPGSSGGENICPDAFGHTGFTGTSFWCDPTRGTAVILLTNAVHPSRECKKNYFPWRNRVHTLANAFAQ